MSRKDPEKDREYQREYRLANRDEINRKKREYTREYMRKIRKERERWRKKNPEKYMEYLKKNREYKREWAFKKAKEKNPNAKHRGFYHDFETHHELAINSGIQSQRDWYECHQRGFFPDGIYSQPNQAFRRK